MKKLIPILIILTFLTPCTLAGNAQQTAVPTTFSVATIKPSQSLGWNAYFEPNGYSAKGVSLRRLLADAYKQNEDRFSGGPRWIDSDKFDVQAKIIDSDTTKLPRLTIIQRRQMLQNLLADRFKLVVHREAKEVPAYALVVDKNGPRLQEALPKDIYQDEAYGAMAHFIRSRSGLIEVKGCPMEVLANFLTTARDSVPDSSPQLVVGRLVLDKTGLTGRYNFILQWAPQGDPDASGPSIFTALQEQLGLKLEPSKGTLDTIVVDHAEQPSEN